MEAFVSALVAAGLSFEYLFGLLAPLAPLLIIAVTVAFALYVLRNMAIDPIQSGGYTTMTEEDIAEMHGYKDDWGEWHDR